MKPTKPITRLLQFCAVVGFAFVLAGCLIDFSFGGVTLHVGEPAAIIPTATPSATTPPASSPFPAAPPALAGLLWRFDLAPTGGEGGVMKSHLFTIDSAASQENIFSDIADSNFIEDVHQHGNVVLALGREVTSVTDSDVGMVPAAAKWILLVSDPALLATVYWSEMITDGTEDASLTNAFFTVGHELQKTPLLLQSSSTPTESLQILTTTVDNYVNTNPTGKELWIDYVLVEAKDALGKPTWLQYDFIGEAGGAGSEIKRKKCCQKCGCCDGDTSDYCQQRGCAF